MTYDVSNHAKYYICRERLFNNFMYVGNGPGHMIPYAHRERTTGEIDKGQIVSPNSNFNDYPYNFNTVNGITRAKFFLSFGESTAMLGELVGLLATEHKMFTQSNLPVGDTEQKLSFALRAINRLDLFAEVTEGLTANLNGYLVRHDAPTGDFALIVSETNSINQGAIDFLVSSNGNLIKNGDLAPSGFKANSGEVVTRYAIKHPYMCSDEQLKKNRNFSHYSQPTPEFTHCPVSRDHLLAILWGLKLAYAMIPDTVVDSSPFQDGETNVRSEIQAIFGRIIDYLETNNYHLTTTNGRRPIGHNMTLSKGSLRRAWAQVRDDNIHTQYHWDLNIAILGQGIGWVHPQMNRGMWLQEMNISGNDSSLWYKAREFGQELFTLNYHMLVNNGSNSFTSGQKSTLKNTAEFYLNTAPCHGTFHHDLSSFAPFGWQSPDRTVSSIGRAWLSGIAHQDNIADIFNVNVKWGNFSALDYLLLHNLYYLNNFTELGTFPSSQNQQCTGICDNFDHSILATEILRVKADISRNVFWYKFKCINEVAGDCVNTARVLRDEAIARANSKKRKCKDECGSKSNFVSKFFCNLNCEASAVASVAGHNLKFLGSRVACFLNLLNSYSECTDVSRLNAEIEKMRGIC